MTHPMEARIRQPSDDEVYDAVKLAFAHETDQQIIAALVRTVVFVAVCYNDVLEGGESAAEVLTRSVFIDCDELAGFFPWPQEPS